MAEKCLDHSGVGVCFREIWVDPGVTLETDIVPKDRDHQARNLSHLAPLLCHSLSRLLPNSRALSLVSTVADSLTISNPVRSTIQLILLDEEQLIP